MASLGVSLEGRSSSQGDSVELELRHCVSEGTLSELDLVHVCKCALGRQQAHQVVAGMAEAGQSCDEPLHEEEGRPHQDVLAET